MNIFKYIDLAITIVASVQQFISLFASMQPSTPLTGAQIAVAVQPSIIALETAIPSVNIPPALVVDIANAAADAINVYYKK